MLRVAMLIKLSGILFLTVGLLTSTTVVTPCQRGSDTLGELTYITLAEA